jgi:hypothetical protein
MKKGIEELEGKFIEVCIEDPYATDFESLDDFGEAALKRWGYDTTELSEDEMSELFEDKVLDEDIKVMNLRIYETSEAYNLWFAGGLPCTDERFEFFDYIRGEVSDYYGYIVNFWIYSEGFITDEDVEYFTMK